MQISYKKVKRNVNDPRSKYDILRDITLNSGKTYTIPIRKCRQTGGFSEQLANTVLSSYTGPQPLLPERRFYMTPIDISTGIFFMRRPELDSEAPSPERPYAYSMVNDESVLGSFWSDMKEVNISPIDLSQERFMELLREGTASEDYSALEGHIAMLALYDSSGSTGLKLPVFWTGSEMSMCGFGGAYYYIRSESLDEQGYFAWKVPFAPENLDKWLEDEYPPIYTLEECPEYDSMVDIYTKSSTGSFNNDGPRVWRGIDSETFEPQPAEPM